MKVLQLSTFDGRFGAAIAARRLHEALRANDVESNLLVSEVLSDSPHTHGPTSGLEKIKSKARHYIDRFPLRFYPKTARGYFSPNWKSSSIAQEAHAFPADVVHLHWCQSNFVPTPTLPHFERPLVWTFHDMWAFTGGCHYNSGCERYQIECGQCPLLGSKSENDLSRWLWRQKQDVYERLRHSLQIICPSNWLADLARGARLLEGIPVHTIPNPINTRIFKPLDKAVARQLLGLPETGRLVLLGATSRGDKRKGFDLLDQALQYYSSDPEATPLGIVSLGMRNNTDTQVSPKLKDWKIGFLQDEVSLSALYSAVDVVVLPSRQENLSNMLAESLCCGTPCLAFAIGGNGDLISHQVNGYLAKPDDAADMAVGLNWILDHLQDKQRPLIAHEAHQKLSADTLIPQFLKVYRGFTSK